MLKLGSSKLWPEQLKMITGREKMDAQPLIDYFKPLSDFLDEQLKEEIPGWEAKGNF